MTNRAEYKGVIATKGTADETKKILKIIEAQLKDPNVQTIAVNINKTDQ